MATFPTVTHLDASSRSSSDGSVFDQAEDGVIRVRHMYASTVWNFSLTLGPLTSTDKDAVLSHYAGDKNSSFSYTWPGDGSSYTVVYKGRPQQEEARDAWGMWYVKVELTGT